MPRTPRPKTQRVDLRLDEETDATLDRLAEEMRASRSYVVREAIHALARQRHLPRVPAPAPYIELE
jgi:metal-responsive CopG/Arc/MetJ family transcriptional regulator